MPSLCKIALATLVVELCLAGPRPGVVVPNAYAQGGPATISLRLDIEKSTVVVGEPVAAALVATNVSASAVDVPRALPELCVVQRRPSGGTAFETVRSFMGYASNRRRSQGAEPVPPTGSYNPGAGILLIGDAPGSLLFPQPGDYELAIHCDALAGIGDVDSAPVHVTVLPTPPGEQPHAVTMTAPAESMLLEGQWFRAPEGIDSLRALVDTAPASMYAQFALLRLGEYELGQYFDTATPDAAILQRARDYLQRAVDTSTSATVMALASAALARAQPR